jgi:Amidohydrolase
MRATATRRFVIALLLAGLLHGQKAVAEQTVAIKFDRATLEKKWQARIRSLLTKGVVPLIDLESSLLAADGHKYLKSSLPVMDRLGIALIAFDGYQAPKSPGAGKGYRWGYYVHSVVNAYPDRFIVATNGGTNPNWTQGKGGKPQDFIDQTEQQVRSGTYPIMGEFEFRHYMSNDQCKRRKTDRDVSVPADGPNGHRLFRLSEETGLAFVFHDEPEDSLLPALEKMLAAYPKAKAIWAHFGAVRKPELSKAFGPDLARRLLKTYPNLYFDLATGRPNQKYLCTNTRGYGVIWQKSPEGKQTDKLKPAYKAILSEFSTRFVVGFDYGGGRVPLPDFLAKMAQTMRAIMRDLPAEAQHNIGYRNAWKLLTGHTWTQ